jgi:hypothetical protein
LFKFHIICFFISGGAIALATALHIVEHVPPAQLWDVPDPNDLRAILQVMVDAGAHDGPTKASQAIVDGLSWDDEYARIVKTMSQVLRDFRQP